MGLIGFHRSWSRKIAAKLVNVRQTHGDEWWTLFVAGRAYARYKYRERADDAAEFERRRIEQLIVGVFNGN